jgi:AcrR family transcriptional regulator
MDQTGRWADRCGGRTTEGMEREGEDLLVAKDRSAMTGRRRWVKRGDDADVVGDGRRAEIVEATWQLIGTIGLEKTTMRRIADQVNCTTGLVTHYFASKDDVLLSAIRQMMDKSRARMLAATQNLGGVARLRNLVLAALPLDDQRLLEWRVWMAFWGRAYPAPRLRKEQQLRFSHWRKAIRGALDDAISLGELPRSLSVDTEAKGLVAMIVGLSVETIVSGDRVDADAMVAVIERHLSSLVPGEASCRDV